MTSISDWAIYKGLIGIMVILTIMAVCTSPARALPPPLSLEELAVQSDLVIEGRVAKVWLYPQWLTYLKKGGLGTRGITLLKEAPATEEGMLQLIHNFPYKFLPSAQVAVDAVYLAEVQVERTVKGQTAGVIFIPFLRYHFLNDRRLEGPWTERTYLEGEHLKMYLRQNGPFFESTYWNAVRPLNTKGLINKNR